MKEAKAITPEFLSQDIIDVDFFKTFKVFDRLQLLIGSGRIHVKDQFVTPPSRQQKCYTIACIMITITLNVIMINSFSKIQDTALYLLSATSVWTGFAVYIAVITNARFFNGQKNAEFFIKMQKIDRLMEIDKINRINLILKRVNNISMSIPSCAALMMLVILNRENSLIDLSYGVSFYSQITVIIELTYCSNLLIYFVVRLRFMNGIVRNNLSQKEKFTAPDKLTIFSKKNVRQLAAETHDFTTSDTTAYLMEVFDLFSMFQELYRFQLFIFSLKLVFGSLLLFGLILFSVQKNALGTTETFSMVALTIIDVTIATILGIRLQLFFGEVKETKRLCISVMAAHSTGPLRAKAKKMLKVAEETPPKLSIYEMYHMDANIFLSIISLITNMIVTLLQFAFL